MFIHIIETFTVPLHFTNKVTPQLQSLYVVQSAETELFINTNVIFIKGIFLHFTV